VRETVSRTKGSNLRVVLYEGSGSASSTAQDRHALLTGLLEGGFEVTRTVEGGKVASADASPLLVFGRFEGGAPEVATPAADAKVEFRDLSGLSPEAVVSEAQKVRGDTGARKLEDWKPWFPVIDYDRCTNCKQCLTFCLFDVYSVDDKDEIVVQNESNCKTDCPACSRVCPDVAILFPKYKKGPINGDVVREEDIQREAMKVDVSALLGGDIYSALRSRQSDARKRFSTERDESRALLERKKCLKKLQEQLDIPDEVLMTLPSAGDIEERVRRAREKKERRMQVSQSAKDVQQPGKTAEEWGI
jgi:NAD-dependent dihydropyrimidine dehydrogenase PreA subunit